MAGTLKQDRFTADLAARFAPALHTHRVPLGHFAKDGISAAEETDHLASVVADFALQGERNIDYLEEPDGVPRMADFLRPAATFYELASMAGVLDTGTSRPIRVLHVGASLMEGLAGGACFPAYRSLRPHLPPAEHCFLGPELDLFSEKIATTLTPDFLALFPDFERFKGRMDMLPMTLGAAFESNPSFRACVLDGYFDLIVFSNPGFLEELNNFWLVDPAVGELLSRPSLRIAGSSYCPVDFACDKVFLEGCGRYVHQARVNSMTYPDAPLYELDDGTWSRVIWTTGPRPDLGFAPSSVSWSTAKALLAHADHCSPESKFSPTSFVGAWLPDRPECFACFPGLVVNTSASRLEMVASGHEDVSMPLDPDAIAEAAEGDFWVRLDLCLALLAELAEPPDGAAP